MSFYEHKKIIPRRIAQPRFFLRLCCAFALSLCAVFSTTILMAGEITPSWEASAVQEIFDRAVEEGVLPANAYCSADYIARASDRRREAQEMLAAMLLSQRAGARIAAHMLEHAVARGIVGMQTSERALIVEGKMRPLHDDADEGNFHARDIPCFMGDMVGTIALSASFHSGAMAKLSGDDPPGYRHHLNFIVYSLFGAKVDLYRMYLYIESATDADNDAHLKTSYPSSPGHRAISSCAKLLSSKIASLKNSTVLTHSAVSTDNTLHVAGPLPPASFCHSSITFPEMFTILGGFA